MELEVMVKHWV